MPYSNKRPDSPKGKIFEAFKSKGAEAARKLAEKLEVEARRVNRWLKDSGAGFQRTAAAHVEKPAPKPVKAKPKKAAPKKKKQAAKPVKTQAVAHAAA